MMIALSIISIVLTLAGYGVQEITSGQGNDIKKRLTSVANEIYSKIGNNNQLLEQMYEAYSTKNSSIANSILMSAGFGPMISELRKAQNELKAKYKKKKDEVNKENIELNNKYNQATNASAQAGYTFAGNAGAKEVANQLEQYIEGGLTNGETKTTQARN